MALQLLYAASMRSGLATAVIIAGVVLFLRGDSGALAAAAVDTYESDDARDARQDVYGNEIMPAVADYLVDPYGEMYESHAPDSALLELGQPES
jgi:hypothetical protein